MNFVSLIRLLLTLTAFLPHYLCMLDLAVLSPTDPHFQEVWLHQVQRLWLWWHDGWEASDSRWLWGEVHPQQGPSLTLEGLARHLNQLKALCYQPSNKVVWLQKNLVLFFSFLVFALLQYQNLISGYMFTFSFADLKTLLTKHSTAEKNRMKTENLQLMD